MKPILLLLTVLLCITHATPVHAMVFSRENIQIVSVRAPLPPTEEKQEEQKESSQPTGKDSTKEEPPVSTEPVVTRHTISTEIYPMRTAQLDWFFNRASLAEGKGIMVVLENRDELALGWSNASTPFDVFFIQGTGKIQAIVPELVLAELAESLEITGRIKAVLYLKSGEAKRLGLLPGDKVEHSLFTPAPRILQ